MRAVESWAHARGCGELASDALSDNAESHAMHLALGFEETERDPARYRPLMPIAVLEKLAFGLPSIVLYAQGRLAAPILAAGLIDLVLGVLFATSYVKTRRANVR